MSAPPIRVFMDHSQQRLRRGLLTMLAQGSWPGVGGKAAAGWDLAASSSDVYVDPVTYTLMLRPSSLRETFYTSNAGEFSKLGVADFAGLTPSSWEENDKTGVGGSRFLRAQGVHEAGVTTASFQANSAFCVAWFPHGEGGEHEAVRFGWNSTASHLGGVGLRVFSTGKVLVYRDGVLVGEHNVGGGSSDRKDQNRWCQLTCVPCRKRELLVLSDTGEGFSQLFQELDEQDEDPAVTPAGKFWFYVPPPAVADVQVHRVRFPASGVAYSVPGDFAEPPLAEQGPPVFRVYGHRPGLVSASLVGEGLAPFVADGAAKRARVRAALAGDTFTTPSVYGVLSQFEGLPWKTPGGGGIDVTDHVLALSLDVPESPDGVQAEIVLGRLDELEALGVPAVRSQHGRPVKVMAGDVVLLDGQVERLEVEHGLDGDADTARFVVRDPFGPLSRLVFRDPLPLDGVPLLNAWRSFATAAGFPTSALEVEDPGYAIPADGSPTSGEWAVLAEVGDSPAEWLQRLFETYAGDWFYRFVPTAGGVVFRAQPPESLPSVPSVTLWPTHGDAAAQLESEGADPETAALQANSRAYRSLRATVVPSEATEVRVTGVEPRTGQPAYQAYFVDEEAEDATLGPEERPPNWRGEKLVYGLADTLLTSQAAVDRAAGHLAAKLTAHRVLLEFECDLVFKPDGSPLWPGDLVRIEGDAGPHVPCEARVVSFSAASLKDPVAGDDPIALWAWRPATYTVEAVEAEGLPWRGKARRPGAAAALAEARLGESDPDRRRAVRAAVAMLRRGALIRERK